MGRPISPTPTHTHFNDNYLLSFKAVVSLACFVGSKKDTMNKSSESAMHIAVYNSDLDMIEFLLNSGNGQVLNLRMDSINRADI